MRKNTKKGYFQLCPDCVCPFPLWFLVRRSRQRAWWVHGYTRDIEAEFLIYSSLDPLTFFLDSSWISQSSLGYSLGKKKNNLLCQLLTFRDLLHTYPNMAIMHKVHSSNVFGELATALNCSCGRRAHRQRTCMCAGRGQYPWNVCTEVDDH